MSVYPASVTPFDAAGRVDNEGIAKLLAYFRAAGCTGAVFAGTNGEGPSLSAVEKRDLVRTAVPLAQGLEVILGIATPSLDEAIWLAQQSHKAGAAAGLVMPPAYFREASEEGLARWFEALADASPLPLLLYNFPQRTGIPLSETLVARLFRHERVVGLKDSSGEGANLQMYANAVPGARLYVGDETLLQRAIGHGWTGTISGAANVIPEWIVQTLRDPDAESQAEKYRLLQTGLEALRVKGQPGLNKALLKRLGVLESDRVRLPLFETDPTLVEQTAVRLRSLVRFPNLQR
jgi:4-hydroxy-tetrahydrodipicolinate synthase